VRQEYADKIIGSGKEGAEEGARKRARPEAEVQRREAQQEGADAGKPLNSGRLRDTALVGAGAGEVGPPRLGLEQTANSPRKRGFLKKRYAEKYALRAIPHLAVLFQ
jgi:hypothetical protein